MHSINCAEKNIKLASIYYYYTIVMCGQRERERCVLYSLYSRHKYIQCDNRREFECVETLWRNSTYGKSARVYHTHICIRALTHTHNTKWNAREKAGKKMFTFLTSLPFAYICFAAVKCVRLMCSRFGADTTGDETSRLRPRSIWPGIWVHDKLKCFDCWCR